MVDTLAESPYGDRNERTGDAKNATEETKASLIDVIRGKFGISGEYQDYSTPGLAFDVVIPDQNIDVDDDNNTIFTTFGAPEAVQASALVFREQEQVLRRLEYPEQKSNLMARITVETDYRREPGSIGRNNPDVEPVTIYELTRNDRGGIDLDMYTEIQPKDLE